MTFEKKFPSLKDYPFFEVEVGTGICRAILKADIPDNLLDRKLVRDALYSAPRFGLLDGAWSEGPTMTETSNGEYVKIEDLIARLGL